VTIQPIGGNPAGVPVGGRSPGAIEPLITALVQQAPEIDDAIVNELVERLRDIGSPLAMSIARVTELVAEQLVNPGIALPALAMACATLADGIRGTLGQRELEAARYEIETLLPVPDRPAGARSVVPDVPAGNLIRALRPRT